MSQAVEFRHYTPPNSRDDLERRIQQIPFEHADAILAATALLQKLHDAGILSLASGLISAGDTIINHLAAVADAPQAVAGLRSALILGRILNTLDADELAKAMQVTDKDFSLVRVAKVLTSRESRQLAMIGVNLMSVLGKAMAAQNRE